MVAGGRVPQPRRPVEDRDWRLTSPWRRSLPSPGQAVYRDSRSLADFKHEIPGKRDVARREVLNRMWDAIREAIGSNATTVRFIVIIIVLAAVAWFTGTTLL